MSKANEFRTYAEECLTWACAAETPEKKEQYFAMATTWMQAAMLQATKNEQALQVGTNRTNLWRCAHYPRQTKFGKLRSD